MPDIIINWNDDAQITTDLLTAKYGLARSALPPYAVTPYYTGNHRSNAFSVAVGPEIRPGQILNGTSILDLAPTILDYLGVTPPAYMTGKVLDELRGTATASAQLQTPSAVSSLGAD
jgi:hypothetical protein